MYRFLDIFFLVFHSLLVLFILFGWIWKRTRKAPLLVLILTMASWFGLGLRYGFGYCPSTDWHWQVKRKLGESDLPNSFIEYVLERLTGHDFGAAAVDWAVALSGLAAFGISLWLNRRDRKLSCGPK